jgi:thiol-disulfide isomerase/thioredoxin
MKLRNLLAILVVCGLGAYAASASGPLAIGTSVPMAETKMKGVDGTEQTLAGAKKAQGLLVVFTCNHCPFAKMWESRIVELGNAYATKGIGVVAVNANDPGQYPEDSLDGMVQRAKDRGMKFPYVVDATSNVARAFGATRTPEAFLFDKDGKLVYHGAIDDNGQEPAKVENAYLKNALEAVLAGREVPVKETKSIGCGIKFRS